MSYRRFKTALHVPDLFGHDRNSYDVKLFSSDGENLYLILMITTKEDTESKVKFICYCSSFPKYWNFVFETPYILESEDADIKIGSFDANVSPGNNELLILAKGAKMHVFVASLENPGSELKHHIIDGDDRQSDIGNFWWRRSVCHIMGDGKRVSFFDEVHMTDSEDFLYRNREVDLSGNPAVEHTANDSIETRFPSDYHEFTATAVKLSWSVFDGTSMWLYLSDGKFETSLTEIRPDEEGFIDFVAHTPPPFSAVTMMAAGKVKSEHLAEEFPTREKVIIKCYALVFFLLLRIRL